MSCADFFARSGWHCQEIDIGDNRATYISTPITLPGGKPADFYLEEAGGKITISDDGLTVFALRTAGFDLADRRNWRGLEAIIAGTGYVLHENGKIALTFPGTELPLWSERILRVFTSLAAWAEQKVSEGDADFSLTNEVEQILRDKKPDARLERDVAVRLGRASIRFDFRWDDVYIDAVRPTPQSVNPRLRKAIQINRLSEAPNILFIVDDRLEPEKANAEMEILEGTAHTVRLTHFRDGGVLH